MNSTNSVVKQFPLLCGLDSPAGRDMTVVGAKFANLAAVADRFDGHTAVPHAAAIPAGAFADALGPSRTAALAELFHEVAATAGNELINLDTRLARILTSLTLPSALWKALAGWCAAGAPWAVRSSSLVEDGAARSHAGLYESYLHLTTLADVAEAVIACWESFYSPRAVLARLRAGDADPAPRMAVIVQQMVDADLAGVAFTQEDRTLVCATLGTGEHLVSGLTAAHRYDITGQSAPPPPYDQIAALAGELRTHLGHEVDIEWAWHPDGLRLLQVRPVTAALSVAPPTGPVFATTSLYYSEQLPPDIALGDCADVYLSVTTKRSPAFGLAARHDITIDDGWLITLNGTGLNDPARRPQWWDHLTGEVIVDLGPSARQNILPATDLARFLSTVLNLQGDPHTRHTILLRPFIRGASGAVTRANPDRSTTMEHSAEGLLAINRGLTSPSSLDLPPLDDQHSWDALETPEPWSLDQLRQVAAFTQILTELYPGTYLEWVHDEQVPHFIDYSTTENSRASSRTGSTLSGGAARGPLLVLPDDAALTRLSIAPIVSIMGDADVPESRYIAGLLERIAALPTPPIVYADRPYVILSRLIGHVAGFVFAGGSDLCHLAILLREDHVPAIVANLPGEAGDGHLAIVDNGRLHLRAPVQI
ncbi:PEP/pyruvate-binding domain-containing protein [Kribbella speibonae]|uniref:Deoxycytidine triphosphate deaminase n=1 Tax=Kribbella speibonae TaxID=1572660 RepID=A0A4R0JC34_9ACTN|nr:PEP/pyruvate-binding domain-containing protein [Kribbella speibonae]TCC41988.1 deoxycytidine triphosphate deaminase [Kribbella speibonae]